MRNVGPVRRGSAGGGRSGGLEARQELNKTVSVKMAELLFPYTNKSTFPTESEAFLRIELSAGVWFAQFEYLCTTGHFV
jgi:hypothetical protein